MTPSDPKGGAFAIDVALSSIEDPTVTRARLVTYVNRHFTVRSAADSGPETLRSAIDDANAQCGALAQDCIIDFDLQDREIELFTPLPDITANALTITGDAVLNGAHATPGNGFTIRPSGQRYGNVRITGLTVRGFAGNGIDMAGYLVDGRYWSKLGAGCNTSRLR